MRLKKAFFTFLFVLSKILASASPADSAKVTVPTSIRFIHELDFRDGNPIYQRPDTSLYIVDRVNVASDNNYNYLGVPGSAAQSPWFVNLSELFTRTGIRSYDLYILPSDSVRYYNVNKKFTDVEYHNGTFKEQVINIIHTQNISKIWNVGFSFDRFSVKDYMNFSDTYKGSFLLFTSLRSNNGKYNLFAHAYWNSIENQMNGGLLKDSTFIYGNVDNIGITSLGWRISDAKQNQRTKRFHLSQFYDFGGNKIDSTGKTTVVPAIRFNHSIEFERNSTAYVDATPDSSFYENFYYSTSTTDSLHSDVLTNKLAIILPASKLKNSAFFRSWSMSAGVEHQTVKYEQKEKSTWNNLAIEGKIISKYDSADFNAIVQAKYVISGHDQGNYFGNLSIQTKQYLLGSIGGKIIVDQRSPDFYLLNYESNNFIWKNDFSKTKSITFQVNYSLEKYKLAILAQRIQIENVLFVNSNALPQQLGKKLTVNQVKLIKNFKYRTIYFLNQIGLQSNDAKNEIHLATIFSRHSLYYEKGLYRNKLLTSVGFNFSYSSEYYSDAFVPATGLFFNQNEQKTGGYLRVDLFVRAKIKAFQVFLKMENVGDNIGKNSYFLVPHYPQPGKVFRFGVTWRFFDQN